MLQILLLNIKNGTVEIWAASRDWFLEEWGRDTFIALPGLLASTDRFEEAQAVFKHFAKYERNGLIPNRIQENEVLYNTVDASLLYIHALAYYLKVSEDWDFIQKLLPNTRSIVENYMNGTSYQRFGGQQLIKMDEEDGLIRSPAQATWMDADPAGDGSTIVTPRNGKAVEINALWYGALNFMGEWDLKNSQKYYDLAKKVKKSFKKKFWNESENSLYDVIEGDSHGSAVRPNQIFAISHGGNLLSIQKKQQVFRTVTEDLLTPGGLRTLSPRDSNYVGSYDTSAPISEKDWAYHQGTAWPWLIGPYIDALVIVRKSQKKSEEKIKMEIEKVLNPLVRFCLESEYKSLPEVFSGDFPHEPGGTTAQAWSVSEVLRILIQYELL